MDLIAQFSDHLIIQVLNLGVEVIQKVSQKVIGGSPGHVDGKRRTSLPSLLPADVLGSFHHLLRALVLLQRPLVNGHLAVLQDAHLQALQTHTNTHKHSASMARQEC